MKQWKWFGYITVAVLAICAVAILLVGKQTCCLCNSPNYSAPCLVDLETGDILELRLVGPSTSNSTGSAIPAETFSFIRFGSVTGSRQTPDQIELKIPTEEKIKSPALCNKCRKLLPRGYDGRYAMANLENRGVFLINAGHNITVCGYEIQIMQEETLLSILIVDSSPKS